MAEIRGKFITLTASLMEVYQEARQEADQRLLAATGKHWNELDPEGWYDIEHYNDFISTYVKASPSREKAMITLGRNIYPTIKQTVGFPPGLTTPIDFIAQMLARKLISLGSSRWSRPWRARKATSICSNRPITTASLGVPNGVSIVSS